MNVPDATVLSAVAMGSVAGVLFVLWGTTSTPGGLMLVAPAAPATHTQVTPLAFASPSGKPRFNQMRTQIQPNAKSAQGHQRAHETTTAQHCHPGPSQ